MSKAWLPKLMSRNMSRPNGPAQIALRTYLLALSLSLGPSLVPLVFQGSNGSSSSSPITSTGTLNRLIRVLKRELSLDGFAFAVALAVGGGALLRKCPSRSTTVEDEGDLVHAHSSVLARLKHKFASILNATRWLENELSEEQQTFLAFVLSSSLGVLVLQAGRERERTVQRRARNTNATVPAASPTLDLTLLLFVRAVDAVVQHLIIRRSSTSPVSSVPGIERQNVITSNGTTAVSDGSRSDLGLEHQEKSKRRSRWTSRVDAFVFWACSARIMWCFFYEPHRLPKSYVTWIQKLANLDYRFVQTLQLIRANKWSYSQSHSSPLVLQDSATAQGYPASWGDPSLLPAYGGAVANQVWKNLGVTSRPGIGGVPCELLHAPFGRPFGLEGSCTANAALRMLYAFAQAFAIYLPVHFLRTLFTYPQTLLKPGLHLDRLKQILLRTLRSASFLSSFITLYWYSVCLTRTLLLPRLFPRVSHNFWDGPYGCVMAACLTSGSSIWVEEGRRRGEMALYVLPRAIRACLPENWVRSRGRVIERLTFILSMATLLTAATHRLDTLRGLSRWTLIFITTGSTNGKIQL